MSDTTRCAATGRDTSRPGIYLHLAEGSTLRVVSASGTSEIDAAALAEASTFPTGTMQALGAALEGALHERAAADAEADLAEQASAAAEQLEAFGDEHDAEIADQVASAADDDAD